MNHDLILLIPLIPLLGFAINGLGGKRFNVVGSGLIASVAVTISFVVSVKAFLHVRETGEVVSSVFEWFEVGGFEAHFGFRIDQLSAIMCLVVTGVGALIHVYSIGYMDRDKNPAKFFAFLNLFIFAMLCLVMGDNLILMFLGWEGVGLCSYLLIGFWYEENANADAGKKAFIVNRIGDFGFLLAIFLIFFHFGTVNFDEMKGAVDDELENDGYVAGAGEIVNEGRVRKTLFVDAEHEAGRETALKSIGAPSWTWQRHVGLGALTIVCLLLFVGATGKSAQIPLYVWLPDAMAGPTPVSALIHAATMVTAGVYMIARLHFLYDLAPIAQSVVLLVGAVTAVWAGFIGLTQFDIKKVLAYSTVSQLGFMFMAMGAGAYSAGIFHLVTHAFFKALLFLGSGAVIYACHHEQDMRRYGGLGKRLPMTYFTFIIGALALTGIAPFSGFFSKDEILWVSVNAHQFLGAENHIFGWTVWALGALAAVFTACYSWRMVSMTFHGSYRGEEHLPLSHVHEAPRTMRYVLMILAFGAATVGFIGIPPFIVGESGNMFNGFLDPMIHTAHHESALSPWFFMIVTLALGIVFAFVVGQNFVKPDNRITNLATTNDVVRRLTLWSRAKLYVDEFYNVVIVQPVMWGAWLLFAVVDQGLIDGILNGAAKGTELIARAMRPLQTGELNYYAMTIVAGVLVILAFIGLDDISAALGLASASSEIH
ncbi:MAG: NADH-quinone oxidoreductase subunit L [Planctomycetes bacterium]|nr:NADH-quinone oxidoreductase subunit L [Planctomycetota bacterium]